jgi:hypothetical protein
MSGVLPGPTVPGIGPRVIADLGQRRALVGAIQPRTTQPAHPFIPGTLSGVIEDHNAVVQPGAVWDKFA